MKIPPFIALCSLDQTVAWIIYHLSTSTLWINCGYLSRKCACGFLSAQRYSLVNRTQDVKLGSSLLWFSSHSKNLSLMGKSPGFKFSLKILGIELINNRQLVRNCSLTCSGIYFKHMQYHFLIFTVRTFLVGHPISKRLGVTWSVYLSPAIAFQILFF